MAKGDGSIVEVKRHDGTSYNPKHWRIRLDLGTDEETGKRLVKSCTIAGLKSDARKKRDEMRRDIESGIKPKADKMTFRDVCKEFMQERINAGLSDNRRQTDGSRLDLVCDIIGGLFIKEIGKGAITDLFPEIRKRRGAQGFNVGNTTMREYFFLIRSVFEYAFNEQYILRNPCATVKAPKKDPVERGYLSKDEYHRLMVRVDLAEDEAYRELEEKEARMRARGKDIDRTYLKGMLSICYLLVVRLGMATGMRLGEAIKPVWPDLAGNQLKIPRMSTKTDAGFRVVFLDDETLKHLRKWKRVQKRLLASLGIQVTKQTPMFCNGVGKALDTSHFRHWWDKWRVDNDFDDLLFHELRHTQATLLLGDFMDLKTVQKRLGHSDPSTTLRFYSHAIPDNDELAAGMIGALMNAEDVTLKEKARIIELKSA